MINVFKSIESLCRLYSVDSFISVSEDTIAVYNAPNDDFHIFTWRISRYVLVAIQDTVFDWRFNKIGIS